MSSNFNSVNLRPDIKTSAPEPTREPSKSVDQGEANALQNAVAAEEIQADEKQAPVEQTELSNALDDINSHVQALHRELKFSEDTSTGRQVVQVLNKETDEVIRQFPPDYALKLARLLNDASGNLGSIFDSRA